MKRRRISFFTVEQFEASRALGFPMVDHAFDSEEAERLRGRLAFISLQEALDAINDALPVLPGHEPRRPPGRRAVKAVDHPVKKA